MPADLSLYDLSVRIHFSRGHLSKVENNMAALNATLVRLADAAAHGESRLITFPEKRTDSDRPADVGNEVWAAIIDPQSRTWFAPVAQGHTLAWSVGPARGFSVGPVTDAGPAQGESVLLAGWMTQEAGNDWAALW